MRKKSFHLFTVLFLAIFFFKPSGVFARDPYPNKLRVKWIVAPQTVEDPYGNGPATDPQTMLHDDGTRADIISFDCYFGGRQDIHHFLNDPSVDTMEKARVACDRSYSGYTEVVKPFLKNNKNVLPGVEKYDAYGYEWPIGNFLGRHPKAKKQGSDWVTPLVYMSLYNGDLRSSRCQGGVCTGCRFTPAGPESTWVRITRTKDAAGNPVNQECFAPPYATSGPWWNWLIGQFDSIRGHVDFENLVSAGIFFGIDGEGRPLKSGDNWVSDDRGLESRFYNDYIPAVVREIKRRYPGKTIRGHTDSDSPFFLENDVDFHRESLASDEVHAYLYQGLGIFGWWQGFADYFWITNTLGLGQGWPPMYQTVLSALSKHTDGITGIITGDMFNSDGNGGDFLKFAGSYIGKDVNDTPGAWIYLRETTHKKEEGDKNVSGKYGDYDYYLYRPEDLSNNHTVPVSYPEIKQVAPGTAYQIYTHDVNSARGPKDQFVGRKVASGNRFMSFDVDDGYRYAGRVSSYEVRIVYLDVGTDSFDFQYKNQGNEWVEKVINKTDTKVWKEAQFVIDGANFNNNASEGADALKYPADFRLDFADNPTIIHLVEIRGRGDVSVPPRPKAQVSCEIVKNEGDDPKEGVYSIGLDQDFKVKAVLVDQDGRPINGERVMFAYNTEWNLAKSSFTDGQGAAFGTFNTRNRLDSTGFLPAASWNAAKYALYSVQAYYPGGASYQPSRNDCYLPIAGYTGASSPASVRMKILEIDTSRAVSDGKIKVRYQILDMSGAVVATDEQWIGKPGKFYANDPNYQTVFLSWVGGNYHAAFNNVTVRGSGSFPTVSPWPPTVTPGDPTPTLIVSTPTPSSLEISLAQGWNKVVWQRNYPTDKKFSDVPFACSVVELSDGGFWRVYIKGYGGEDLSLERGKDYFLRCNSAFLWRL